MATPSPAPASTAAIPQIGKVFFTGMWFAAILYGVNCTVYGASIYVLFRRKQPSWLLVFWATLLFTLSTGNAILTFLELYLPIANPNLIGTPGAWDLHWVSPSQIGNADTIVWLACVFSQNLLLIWRLYIVWGRRWKIIILPLMVEFAHISCAYVSEAVLTEPGISYYSPKVATWSLAGFALDIVVNLSLTIAIAGRLWYMGSRNAASGGKFTYRASMFIVLESGGLFATATFICFVMFNLTSTKAASLAGIFSLMQIASITPLLIIVRVGLGLTPARNALKTTTAPSTRPLEFRQQPIRVHVATSGTEDTYPMNDLSTKGNSFVGRTTFDDSPRLDDNAQPEHV